MSATIMLFAGGLMVFTALALTLSLVGVVTTERAAFARSLAAIQALDAAADVLRADVERPLAERVIGPLGERLVGVGRPPRPGGHRRAHSAPPGHRRQPRRVGRGPDHRAQGRGGGGPRCAGALLLPLRGASLPVLVFCTAVSEPSATSSPISSSTTPGRSVRS